MSSFLNLVPFYKQIAKDGKKQPLMNVLGQISVNFLLQLFRSQPTNIVDLNLDTALRLGVARVTKVSFSPCKICWRPSITSLFRKGIRIAMSTSNGYSISSEISRVSLQFKEFGSAISLRTIHLFAKNKCHGTIK